MFGVQGLGCLRFRVMRGQGSRCLGFGGRVHRLPQLRQHEPSFPVH